MATLLSTQTRARRVWRRLGAPEALVPLQRRIGLGGRCCTSCPIRNRWVLVALHPSHRHSVVEAGLQDCKALVGLRPLASKGDLLLCRQDDLTTCSSVFSCGIPRQLLRRGVSTQLGHHLVHQLVAVVLNRPGFHRFGLLGRTPCQVGIHQLLESRTLTLFLDFLLLRLL